MSNEKFTQGEWVVKDGHYPSMIDIHCGDCMRMCVVITATDLTFEQGIEREANAHLISAAPDMYRALRGLLEAHRHVYGLDGAWDSEVKAAEKALAKADGG